MTRVAVFETGKDADTLKAFCAELDEARCAKLDAVTLDISGATH